ncbi:MAG: hypothetical protein ACI9NG_001331 [Hyphomonas sp.]|jgi:hypothetical protein
MAVVRLAMVHSLLASRAVMPNVLSIQTTFFRSPLALKPNAARTSCLRQPIGFFPLCRYVPTIQNVAVWNAVPDRRKSDARSSIFTQVSSERGFKTCNQPAIRACGEHASPETGTEPANAFRTRA